MLFDFADLAPRDRYKLLVSTVVPRPIAWVVTRDDQGLVNAAPFSFFNAVSGDPPLVIVGMGERPSGGEKDTAANIRANGQFVVNMVSAANGPAMNVTAIDFPPRLSAMLPTCTMCSASVCSATIWIVSRLSSPVANPPCSGVRRQARGIGRHLTRNLALV